MLSGCLTVAVIVVVVALMASSRHQQDDQIAIDELCIEILLTAARLHV